MHVVSCGWSLIWLWIGLLNYISLFLYEIYAITPLSILRKNWSFVSAQKVIFWTQVRKFLLFFMVQFLSKLYELHTITIIPAPPFSRMLHEVDLSLQCAREILLPLLYTAHPKPGASSVPLWPYCAPEALCCCTWLFKKQALPSSALRSCSRKRIG